MNEHMSPSSQTNNFINGLVFGFDVGTGSIGWAVRRGAEFKDVGVLICDSDVGDLSNRRNLRRQRRTLRSKKYRNQWLAKELATILDLKLHDHTNLPASAWQKNTKGRWIVKPGLESLLDPVALRVKAINGDKLSPEQLHAAITHLWKRRGYLAKVPWGSQEESKSTKKTDEEWGSGTLPPDRIQSDFDASGYQYPCKFLAQQTSQRRRVWPRELLEKEFNTIIAKQAILAGNLNYTDVDGKEHTVTAADWLLYGDTQEVKGKHVYFKSTTGRNPGVLGLRWPRFDNRGPALDAMSPTDEQGRPLHVVRKNKNAFRMAQWELAVLNFRVIDVVTGALVAPDAKALARLREMWESSRHRGSKKKGSTDACGTRSDATSDVKVSEALLKKWAAEFSAHYRLVAGQQPLTPQTGAGRSRFASPTLNRLRNIIASGQRPNITQPVLRRTSETVESALNRYLANIKHPLVRHRLVLFRRLLGQLVSRYGKPDMLVLEAVRNLAMNKKGQEYKAIIRRIEENRKERASIRDELADNQQRSSRNAILRYRLWKEAESTCPFCCQKITQEQLFNGEADIEHLVPRSVVDCNEFYNLTIGHIRCNREDKGEHTPSTAFARTEKWEQLKENATKCFKNTWINRHYTKADLFISPTAEELIEQKADLQHTAYIARVIRHISLIQLGWLNNDGKDPTPEKQNAALRFQVTNGQLTSRLRLAWGLNQILRPLPNGKRWEDLNEEEQRQLQEKNRGDLRHHALDAMVIACTLPWLAHRTHGAIDEYGNHGWWTQDEKRRSKAVNPLFPREGQMHKICKEWMDKATVRHHVSRSSHQQAYATTLYAKKADNTYVAREVFTALTPRNLGSIWPQKFAAYCEQAWEQYIRESLNINEELNKTRGCVPETFTRRLCFSHFQQWRAAGMQTFTWPEQVKIPIRSVKLISVKDNSAVMPFSSGTHAFVKRTGFKEIRIHISEDGKSFVPVFIPYWKGDIPFYDKPIKAGSTPVVVIRRGMVVETKRPFSTGQPPGKYRVLVTGQVQIKLLPHNVANKEESILSFGLGKKGIQLVWSEFMRALGYELPYRPSDQAESAGAASA